MITYRGRSAARKSGALSFDVETTNRLINWWAPGNTKTPNDTLAHQFRDAF
jgi:hypothetical protein